MLISSNTLAAAVEMDVRGTAHFSKNYEYVNRHSENGHL